MDVAYTRLTALTRVMAGPASQPPVRLYRGVVTNYDDYYYYGGVNLEEVEDV